MTLAAKAITTVVESTYGTTPMADALAEHLIEKFGEWDGRDEETEREIMLTCWNWFSGGTTAESAAHQIKMRIYEERS